MYVYSIFMSTSIRNVKLYKMRKFIMFITAVCILIQIPLILIKLRWPKNNTHSDGFPSMGVSIAAAGHRGNTFLGARYSILLVSGTPQENCKMPATFKLFSP